MTYTVLVLPRLLKHKIIRQDVLRDILTGLSNPDRMQISTNQPSLSLWRNEAPHNVRRINILQMRRVVGINRYVLRLFQNGHEGELETFTPVRGALERRADVELQETCNNGSMLV